MTTKDELRIITNLRSMSFTQGMEPKHVKKLASLSVEVKFATNDVIFREGDEGKAIFLIEEGQIIVEAKTADQENPVPILIVEKGDLLGWSSLFPPRRKTSSARATMPTWALAIDVARLQDAFRSDHSLEVDVIRRVADVLNNRLRNTRQYLLTNLPTQAD
jgi:CRP-like cAMP-binding protein